MIHEFGSVMLYVENPRAIADFWVRDIGFVEGASQVHDGRILSVEVARAVNSEVSIVLFDRAVVAEMSPELNLGTPSILFSTQDAAVMRARLESSGVTVGDLVDHGGMVSFNFADPEGNYFAVREVGAPTPEAAAS